jgi:hypothetical protein
MVNKPAEDEARSVETFVAVFVAITLAPGTTAPLLSVTVPEMVPSPAVCALSATGIATGNATANRKSALHTVLATLLRKMLSLEFMMTSIEMGSVNNCPAQCLLGTVLIRQGMMVKYPSFLVLQSAFPFLGADESLTKGTA